MAISGKAWTSANTRSKTSNWTSKLDSTLPMQGAWVQSPVGGNKIPHAVEHSQKIKRKKERKKENKIQGAKTES